MGRMTWFKMFVNFDDPERWTSKADNEELGAWVRLLRMASLSPENGVIEIAKGVPYTEQQIKMVIKTEKDYLKKWKEQGAIKIENGVISIEKWSSYQSEYNRQKPHRQKEFVDKREQIKNRDDYTCQKCYKTEEELEVPLCIHHIDNNPDNNETSNLITLCMSCHSALLKKNVHFTKESERLEQEKEFREKVQQKSSTESSTVEERRKKKEVRSKKKEEKTKNNTSATVKNPVAVWCEKFKAKFGEQYIITPKDAGHLNRVYKLIPEQFESKIDTFFETDNFAHEYNVSIFQATLNKTKKAEPIIKYGKDY